MIDSILERLGTQIRNDKNFLYVTLGAGLQFISTSDRYGYSNFKGRGTAFNSGYSAGGDSFDARLPGQLSQNGDQARQVSGVV